MDDDLDMTIPIPKSPYASKWAQRDARRAAAADLREKENAGWLRERHESEQREEDLLRQVANAGSIEDLRDVLNVLITMVFDPINRP